MTPLPVLIIVFIGIMCLYFKYGKVYQVASVLFVIVLLSYWFKNYYFNYSYELAQNNHALLFFNVADSRTKNIDALKSQIETYNIDTAVLVESHFISKQSAKNFENAFDDFYTKFLFGSMFATSKYPIEYVKYIKELKKYRLSHIKVNSKTRPLSIAIVDIYANPLFDRSYSLNKIVDYVEANKIDVIVGDFNTPFESIHFKNYNTNYIAMRSYQKGFSATWFYGFPLLELDQMWIRKTLQPIALQKAYFTSSDHAMLMGYFK